jgi:hypothetical protein
MKVELKVCVSMQKTACMDYCHLTDFLDTKVSWRLGYSLDFGVVKIISNLQISVSSAALLEINFRFMPF